VRRGLCGSLIRVFGSKIVCIRAMGGLSLDFFCFDTLIDFAVVIHTFCFLLLSIIKFHALLGQPTILSTTKGPLSPNKRDIPLSIILLANLPLKKTFYSIDTQSHLELGYFISYIAYSTIHLTYSYITRLTHRISKSHTPKESSNSTLHVTSSGTIFLHSYSIPSSFLARYNLIYP
jgi:hypothetical protein